MIVNDQDNGRAFSIRIGEDITLNLPESPTTGYRWSIVSSSGLELISDQNVTGSETMGAAGRRILQFRAMIAGQSSIQLREQRGWGESPSIGEFTITLRIT